MSPMIRIVFLLGLVLLPGFQPAFGQDDEEEEVESPLNKAVRSNNLALVKKLVAAGEPVNTDDFMNPEPIELAVEFHFVEIAKYLLEQGAKSLRNFYEAVRTGDLEWVKLLHSYGFTDKEAIIPAIESGNLATVHYLIDNGFSVDFSQKRRLGIFRKECVTPIEIACQENKAAIALELVKGGVPIVEAYEEAYIYGMEAFMIELINLSKSTLKQTDQLFLKSIRMKTGDFAARCLSAGANPLATYESGNSALLLSIAAENMDLIKRCYTEWKVNPAMRNKEGETALMKAVRLENTDVALFVWNQSKMDINERDNDGNSALFHAIHSGSAISQLTFLLSKGAQIDLQNHMGNTPLMDAAWYGFRPVWEFLLSNGANVNLKNKTGLNVLSYMIDGNTAFKVEDLKRLCDMGIDMQVVSQNGKNLAYYAADRDDLAFLNYLVEKKCSVDPMDAQKQRPTPMNDEVIRFVVEHGGDPNRVGTWYTGYLEETLLRNSYELSVWLIQKGANVNYKKSRDEPILQSLIEKDELEAVRILVESGADVNAVSRWGKFMIEVAEERGTPEIVAYLRSKGAMNKAEFAEFQIKRTRELGSLSDLTAAKNTPEIMRILTTYTNVVLTLDQIKKMAYLACEQSNMDLLAYLVDKQQMRWNIKLNFEQHTMLHISAKLSTEEFVSLLINKGADPNLKDAFGKLPVNYASNKAIKKMLKAAGSK
jgi:ankyrin repeat protein